MSYFPPPPPGYPVYDAYRPTGGTLTPARRAAVSLWLMGALLGLCGTCVGLSFLVTPMDQIAAQAKASAISPEQKQMFENPQMLTVLRVLYTTMSVVSLAVGLGMLASGFFVWGGRRWATVGATLLCGLLAIGCALAVLMSVASLVTNLVVGLVGCVVSLAAAGVVGLTMTWLFQALRSPAGGDAAQQQYLQTLYWQHQQQQFGGYGYGAPGAAQPPTPQMQQPPQGWINLPPPPPPPSEPNQPPDPPQA